MAGTYTPPSAGEKRTTGDKKAREGLEGFNNLLDGSNKIPGTSLAAAAEILNAQLKGEITNAKLAGSIEDTKLSSPNNSTYKLLNQAAQWFGEDNGAATYPLQNRSGKPNSSGFAHVTLPLPVFGFAKADYEVAGKTQKLRIRAQALTNEAKPTITFTVGLYPITVGGAVDALTLTLGTVVSGSTVAIAEPAANTATSSVGSDFTIPSDGVYILGVVLSGTLTNNADLLISAQLQSRNV